MKKILALILSVFLTSCLVLVGISCKEEAAEETLEEEGAKVEEEGASTVAGIEDLTTEDITLKVVWSCEGDIPGGGDFFTEIASKYNEEHPNIEIEITEHTLDQLMPAWQAAVAAGEGPDVQFLWGGVWGLEDVWAGNVINITTIIPEDEWKHWTCLWDVTYKGEPWTVPWYSFTSPILLYNKVLFKQAGLDPENPPTNWDEFLAACEALKNEGITGYTIGLKDAWGAEPVWSLIGPGTLDDISEVKLAATEEGGFLTDKNMGWLEKLYTLYQEGYLNEDIMSLDYIPGEDVFAEGNTGFGHTSSSRISETIEQMGGQEVADIMPWPAFGSGKMAGRMNLLCQTLAVPVFSEHQKEAADFIMFLHRPDNIKLMYDYTSTIIADDRFDTEWIEDPVMKKYYEMLSSSESIPYIGLYAPTMVISDGIYVAGQMVCSGKTPDEAAAHIEDIAAKWRELSPEAIENFKNWAE